MTHMPEEAKNILIKWLDGNPGGWWNETGSVQDAYDLLNSLWNCTDMVPAYTRSAAVGWLESCVGIRTERALLSGCTYSQLVRQLRPGLDRYLHSHRKPRNTQKVLQPKYDLDDDFD